MCKHRFALWLLVIFTHFPVQAEETLVFNTAFSAPLVSADHTGALDILYRTLGSKLGLDIEIGMIPAERALLNANAGIEDGDVCRIAGLEENYPNLLRMPEEIMHVQISVFSKLPAFKPKGVASLKPYHVGYLIGWKVLELNVTDVKQVTRFATDLELFNALEKNLIDVAIIEKSQGIALLTKGTSIRVLEPELLKLPCYLYLNKKHSLLIPKISDELIKMKSNGSYEKIFKNVMRPYQLDNEY